MATPLCDIDGSRPAVATVRIRENGGTVTRNLCEEHLAEVRAVGAGSCGGRSLFDEFFSDFFEDSAAGGRQVGRDAPGRVEQIDVTEYFSDATRELLQRAAQQAVEWGGLGLDSDHLLWAAVQDDVVSHVLAQLGAEPARSRSRSEEAEKGARTDVAPSLSPDAKAALLAAYEESRQLGASYVGPEHVLLALARDEEDPAGELLSRFGVTHTKLRGAVIRGVEAGEGGGRPASTTRALDERSRFPRGRPRRETRPGGRASRRDRADDRDPLAPNEERSCPARRPRRRARLRSSRESHNGSSTTRSRRR